MSTVTIKADIDGQERNIDECFWTTVSPCGCTSGAMTTRQYGSGLKVIGFITTVEAAWIEFEKNRGIREQEIARGVTIKLIHRDEYMALMQGDCPHTPRFGRNPIPEGTEWGRATSGRVIHLVDKTEGTATVNYEYRDPKCGAKRALFQIHNSVHSEAPMCKKCLAIGAAA